MTRETGSTHRVAATIAGLALLLLAFAAHAVMYGAWIIDDAGISLVYALNIAHGHGLVAQPGAIPVEGFSNPLWVGLLSLAARVGLIGRGQVGGISGHVAVIKGLALALHVAVLCSLGLLTRELIAGYRGGRQSHSWTLGAWALTGVLLAANPSYVIWMTGGLENPLLAALAAAIAAASVRFVREPRGRWLLTVGALAGLAALTRPDGVLYGLALGSVALPVGLSAGRRWSLLWPATMAFLVPPIFYQIFRLSYFGAWLPNTAVAKSQSLPAPGDALRAVDLIEAFGIALSVVTAAGIALGLVSMWRGHSQLGLRLAAAALLVLGIAVSAQVLLETDWMRELRFATPVWPLLTTASALAMARLVAAARGPAARTLTVFVLAIVVGVTLANWVERASDFRSTATVPLCVVAHRMGSDLNATADDLGLRDEPVSILVPDIGGALLVSELRVMDLAGLIDPEMAALRRAGDPSAIADHILRDMRPTIINAHSEWFAGSGLDDHPQFAADYVELVPGQDWVRRDSLDAGIDLGSIGPRLQARADRSNTRQPTADCAELFP